MFYLKHRTRYKKAHDAQAWATGTIFKESAS